MKLKKKVITIIVIIIIVIIGIVYLLIANKDNGKFEGFWTIDGYTNYEFLDNNKGNLVLPHKKMEFTYKIKNNTLCIDFKDKKIIDKCYEYKFDNKKLVIKDSSNNVFTLTKE